MIKSESGIISDLIDGAEGQLDYHKAIKAEDKRIGKGSLKVRQKKVVKGIMEDLKNNEEGGTGKMTVKGNIKIAKTTKKVVPPKVNLETVKLQAMSFLEGLEKVADFGNIKYELEKVNIGILNFKQNSRLIFGVRYSVCGDKVTYSLVTKETFKNFSKELQGKYSPGNWNILFDFVNGNDIKKFNPIIQASIEKLKKTELPKDKVEKKK